MSLLGLCQWLGDTPSSIALHESEYAYTIVESVHVLTLCLFLGMTGMLDLRLLGVTMRRVPVSEVVQRFLPWMKAGFAVMIVSGATLFYAIPVRSFQSVFFRVKMLMLILAGLNAWAFHRGIYRKVADWDLRPAPRRARVAGALSLILWASIVIAGRMIAYNWFDCDRQPQPAIINWAAGCRTP
jgi:hypothetical protein